MFFLYSGLFTELCKWYVNSCLSYPDHYSAVPCGLHNKITSLDHKLLVLTTNLRGQLVILMLVGFTAANSSKTNICNCQRSCMRSTHFTKKGTIHQRKCDIENWGHNSLTCDMAAVMQQAVKTKQHHLVFVVTKSHFGNYEKLDPFLINSMAI